MMAEGVESAVPDVEYHYHAYPGLGLRDIFHGFGAGWSGTHGVAHIIFAKNCKVRSFWSFVTGAAFLCMLAQLVILLQVYLAFPSHLDIAMNSPATIPFPTVTICNANAWKKGSASGTALDALVSAYNVGVGPSVEYGFDGPPSEEKRLRALHWMWLMGEELIEADRNGSTRLSYSWDDLFISCRYAQKECNSHNFTDFYTVQHGHCHKFNTDGLLNASSAGPNNGLRLVIRVANQDYLPWNLGVGIIYSPDRTGANPYEDVYGHYAPTGFSSNAGMEYVERTKLPAPFSNCTQGAPPLQPVYYSGSYRIEACYRSCTQDRIVSQCGCYNPKYNAPVNSTARNATISCWDAEDRKAAIDCTMMVEDAVNSSWNVRTNCSCPEACEQSHYPVSVSLAHWPAANFKLPECVFTNLNSTTADRCLGINRNDTLQLNVYFNQISVKAEKESPAYEVIQFISDFAGTAGLWLGMSTICVIEWVILFALIVRWFLCSPKRRVRRQASGNDNEYSSNRQVCFLYEIVSDCLMIALVEVVVPRILKRTHDLYGDGPVRGDLPLPPPVHDSR